MNLWGFIRTSKQIFSLKNSTLFFLRSLHFTLDNPVLHPLPWITLGWITLWRKSNQWTLLFSLTKAFRTAQHVIKDGPDLTSYPICLFTCSSCFICRRTYGFLITLFRFTRTLKILKSWNLHLTLKPLVKRSIIGSQPKTEFNGNII